MYVYDTLLDCLESGDLTEGEHTLSIHGVNIDAEVYVFPDDVHYTESPILGSETPDQRMLILIYNGNLTIDEGVVVTPQTRKRGMAIYVKGDCNVFGTISMTARGAKAAGQDVYLYKGKSGRYEFIPEMGEQGGASVKTQYIPEIPTVNGRPGFNATFRRSTGGGGSGGAMHAGFIPPHIATSGSGSAGTSYSGGTGGGGAYNAKAKDGAPNGGAGGDASYGFERTSSSGGAGNPGGARNSNRGEAGENGTGGLLIFIVKNQLFIDINAVIESNGSKGGSIGGAGGSSGGGSINIICYALPTNNGTIHALGGAKAGNGGAGGNGSVSISLIEDNFYFVSQQTGNDGNDGLTPQAALATIAGAIQKIRGTESSETLVYVAPGIYNERLVVSEGTGEPFRSNFVFFGDTDCLFFSGHNKGQVLIIDQGDEVASINLVEINSFLLGFLEFRNFSLSGNNCDYAIYKNTLGQVIIDNCHITGHNGVYGVDAYNSTIFARNYAANKSNLYNCVVIGGVNSVYDSASSGSKLNNSLVFVPDVGVHTNQRTRNSLVYGAKTAYLSDTNTGYSSAICCKDGFGGGSTGTGNRYSCVETGVTTKQTESPLALFDVKIKPIAVDESMFLPKYELDYEDFKYNAPSIKLKGRSQYKIKASVQKGSFIKSLWIKSYNTNPELMPYIIVKFAGKDRIKEAICSVNWELLSICFDSAFDGVAELVLVTQDPNPESYTLFSDIY